MIANSKPSILLSLAVLHKTDKIVSCYQQYTTNIKTSFRQGSSSRRKFEIHTNTNIAWKYINVTRYSL